MSDGAIKHGQSLQAEEVELHQSRRFHVLHGELRDRHVGLWIAIERHQFVQPPVADHHTRRMRGGMAVQPLKLQGLVDQVTDSVIVPVLRLQHRFLFQRLLQGDRIGRIVRHHLGNPVDLAIGHLQHPPDVAQHRAGLQLSEGDDLRHLVMAVLVLHVADDLVAPVLAEVDVEVGHGHAFGVQEPLEQQAIAQGIQIRDGQNVGDQRPGTGPAPRPHRDALALGPLDEVGNDQEIAGEIHVDDDAEFQVQPFPVDLLVNLDPLLRHGRKARIQASVCHGAQFVRLTATLRRGETGQDRIAPGGHEAATARDHQRVADRLRHISEQRLHLVSALEPVFRRQAATFRLADISALRHTDQGIMGVVHAPFEEEAVVGGDQRHILRHRHVDHHLLDLILRRQAMTLQFDIGAARKQSGDLPQPGPRRSLLSIREQPPERSRGPAGQQDQPVGQAIELALRQMGIESGVGFEERGGNQLHQIAVADRVLHQQDDGGQARPRQGRTLTLFHAEGDGELAADDRLHSCLCQCRTVFHGAEEVVGVRHRDGRHAELRSLHRQILRPDRPLRQGVGTVQPQMYEIGMTHGPVPSDVSRDRSDTGTGARRESRIRDRSSLLDARLSRFTRRGSRNFLWKSC